MGKVTAKITVFVMIILAGLTGPSLARTGNPSHDALAAMNSSDQRATLVRFLTSDGNAGCSDAISIYDAGLDPQRNAFWDVRCREGAMYRVSLPSARWSRPSALLCGAAATPPAGGPCFRPAAEGLTAVTDAQAGNAAVAGQCRVSCAANQPAGLVAACTQRCIVGGGVEVGAQASAALPPGTRFGVIFASDTPLAAHGFGNGQTDRLAVNMAAARACQAQAGRAPCKFRAELVNTCGALVQAISRNPGAIAITADPSTYVVNRLDVATGPSQAAAEAEALRACRAGVSGPGVQCIVAASGC